MLGFPNFKVLEQSRGSTVCRCARLGKGIGVVVLHMVRLVTSESK